MVKITTHHLPPTPLVPNSPYPLLHYHSAFTPTNATIDPIQVYDRFTAHDWDVQWIFRYGPTQQSHYHSQAHEAMCVLSGTATIRFGVADADLDLLSGDTATDASSSFRGVTLQAKAGDVFLLPAGTAHKTHDTSPVAEFKLLTPGDGHGMMSGDARGALAEVRLDGFTMMGAYPRGSQWDFAVGGEDVGRFERVWGVSRPDLDPVLGKEGLGRYWREQNKL
ncbi:DNA repair protein rhp54 [Sphaceloma murrayae]|uniref:DNA repair protein rhp54 n=1 Tax=Sphaceloma murrayae TaxID=2082308 RepID=A0A2K1QIH1_9PEZI|nr:DNA repair protein rhp54 [Sphaceloma murrayae]